MKLLGTILALFLAFSAVAAEDHTQDPLLAISLDDVPFQFDALHAKQTEEIDLRRVLIDARPIPSVDNLVEWAVRKCCSDVIVAELLGQRGVDAGQPLAEGTRNGIRIADLGSYRVGESYDWARISADFGDVAAIVQVSRPLTDAAATIMITHYKISFPDGFSYVTATDFLRENATWRKRGTAVDLTGAP